MKTQPIRLALAGLAAAAMAVALPTAFMDSAAAVTRSCSLTQGSPYKTGSSVAITAHLRCSGQTGPGSIVVEIGRDRWWGNEVVVRRSFNVPLNSDYYYTTSTSCAGQGTYTYSGDAVAWITFPAGGGNTVAEYHIRSGSTRFTC